MQHSAFHGPEGNCKFKPASQEPTMCCREIPLVLLSLVAACPVSEVFPGSAAFGYTVRGCRERLRPKAIRWGVFRELIFTECSWCACDFSELWLQIESHQPYWIDTVIVSSWRWRSWSRETWRVLLKVTRLLGRDAGTEIRGSTLYQSSEVPATTSFLLRAELPPYLLEYLEY